MLELIRMYIICTVKRESPLIVACYQGNYDLVQFLRSNGAGINLCHQDEASPLFMACEEGHDTIVQLLPSNGADINLY